MSKKKKIAKLTEEQYFQYIMGLKNGTGTTGALFNADGDVLVPDSFANNNENEKQGD